MCESRCDCSRVRSRLQEQGPGSSPLASERVKPTRTPRQTPQSAKPTSKQSFPTPADRYSQQIDDERHSPSNVTASSRRRLLDTPARDGASAKKRARIDLTDDSEMHESPQRNRDAHPQQPASGLSYARKQPFNAQQSSERQQQPGAGSSITKNNRYNSQSGRLAAPAEPLRRSRPASQTTSPADRASMKSPAASANTSRLSRAASSSSIGPLAPRPLRPRVAHHVEEQWPSDKAPEDVVGVCKNDDCLYMLVRWCGDSLLISRAAY
jgi:hypothetical protein